MALIRLSAILFVGLMVGHMSAYPWTSIPRPQDTQFVESIKAIDFVFLENTRRIRSYILIFAS